MKNMQENNHKPPIMPKATAVWLIDNTTLTFEQIADFCKMHPLEIQSIADGEIAQNIIGANPIVAGQIEKEEIEKAQKNIEYKMKKLEKKIIEGKKRKTPKYTPLAVRHKRPDAIAWLVQNHQDMPDAYIIKMLGTTKNTINSIREKSHWNIANIKQVDPVTLGLCSQAELNEAVEKTHKKNLKEKEKLEKIEKQKLEEQKEEQKKIEKQKLEEPKEEQKLEEQKEEQNNAEQ